MLVLAEVDLDGCVEHGFGYCAVCGVSGLMVSYDPIDFPCKRNAFICQKCGSVGRNRHVAHAVLGEFRDRLDCSSLSTLAPAFGGNIWIGCVKEAVSMSLGVHPNVFRSEFIDGVAHGEMHDGVQCQDIQATTFDDNFFDLIISEDVLEHVPDPGKAFSEIRRILRPGGKHVFTIPIDWSAEKSYQRAAIVDGELVHIHEPEVHGDPFRKEGVLAYYTFGRDVVDALCSITGPTKMLAAHGDRMLEKGFLIYNSWVFVSEKVA